MSNYTIFTDSGSDISPSLLKEWGVSYIPMTFRFEGEDRDYRNDEVSAKAFYARLRGGEMSKTAAINMDTFKAAFEPTLQSGSDILYLSFSSGLSATSHIAELAAEELKEAYPERTVTVVDTLAASAGQGLTVYLAVQKKNEGADMATVAQYITDIRLNICHWFTVDDLQHLKRGGRVSPTVALVGSMLGIKPVLHVDNEGHLISRSKVRGRHAALKALADKVGELSLDLKGGTVFLSHGDCIDDAKIVEDILKNEYGVTIDVITDIGPVIGSHSGAGTVAIFFVGQYR